MGKLLLQLGNSQNWENLYSTRYESVSIDGGRKFIPIPPQTLPVLASRRILAVGGASMDALGHWKLAGWLIPKLYIPGISYPFLEANLPSEKILLNDYRLIILPDLGHSYRLEFQVPKWLKEVDLDIWSYVGPEEDTGEFLRGRVRRTVDYTPNRTPTQVLATRRNRTSATLFNASTSLIYIGFSSNLSPSNAPETLYPGGQWSLDGGDIGEIWMVSDTVSSTSVQIIEYAQD